jgi:ZIP family zinc transporter
MFFNQNLLYPLLLAGIAGLATFIGVFIGRLKKGSTSGIVFSSAFAAGIMILISLLELFPAATKDGNFPKGLFYLFFGVVGIAVINYLIPHIHSAEECQNKEDIKLINISYLIAIGLILHDFPEGFAIPSSLSESSVLGLTVFASIFIHNIPEGFAMTIASGKIKSAVFYRLAFFSALSTILGAFLGTVLINNCQQFNKIFLSLAAGAMLYISLHELLPYAIKCQLKKPLILGLLFSLFLYLIMMFFGE